MSALTSLENFRSQYPTTTSADLQAFTLGYKAAIKDMKSKIISITPLMNELAALVTYLCDTLDSGDENKVVYAIAKLRQLIADGVDQLRVA